MPHGNNGSGHGGFMGLFNPVPISEVIDFFFFYSGRVLVKAGAWDYCHCPQLVSSVSDGGCRSSYLLFK